MYHVAATDIPGKSRRTFRVSGLGVYTPNEIVMPTVSATVFQRAQYPFVKSDLNFDPGVSSVRLQSASGASCAPPSPKPGVGMSGLGLDLSSLTASPLFWGAALVAGYFLFFRRR